MDKKPLKRFFLGDRGVNNIIYVGIGETVIGHNDDILKISALGSCIGLVIYVLARNNLDRCAIMGHIMLAHSPQFKKTRKEKWGPAKYADKAIPFMIGKLKNEGHLRKNFRAKMVGGAKLIRSHKKSLQIGDENSNAVKTLLNKENIALLRSYTGGDSSMSVSFNVSNYALTITHKRGRKLVL